MFFDENDIKGYPSELTKDDEENEPKLGATAVKTISAIIGSMIAIMAILCFMNL